MPSRLNNASHFCYLLILAIRTSRRNGVRGHSASPAQDKLMQPCDDDEIPAVRPESAVEVRLSGRRGGIGHFRVVEVSIRA